MSDNFPLPTSMFANWALSTHTATYVAVWPYVRRAVFRTRPFQIIGGGAVTLGTTEGIRQPPPITNPGYFPSVPPNSVSAGLITFARSRLATCV